jgi:hypothetical protein
MVSSPVIVMPMSPSLICVSFATWEMAVDLNAYTCHATTDKA